MRVRRMCGCCAVDLLSAKMQVDEEEFSVFLIVLSHVDTDTIIKVAETSWK